MLQTWKVRMGRRVGLLLLFGLCLSAALAQAQPNTGKISLGAGVDFPTAYYFRGILQEDEGFIAQPYGEIGFNLYESEGPFSNATAALGIWNSFHSGDTGTGGDTARDPRSWYEADLYAKIGFGFIQIINMEVAYIAYTSPNGSFSDVQELDVSFGIDDSQWLGDFALNPSLTFAFELDGQADGGGDEGIYMQLGAEPSWHILKDATYPLTLSIPLVLGLSLKDYYEDPDTDEDDTFGFFDAGAALSMPLGFIPAAYGAWDIYAAVHFLFLGDTTEKINDGDSFKVYGMFGVSLAY
jgi:hypothetical protein